MTNDVSKCQMSRHQRQALAFRWQCFYDFKQLGNKTVILLRLHWKGYWKKPGCHTYYVQTFNIIQGWFYIHAPVVICICHQQWNFDFPSQHFQRCLALILILLCNGRRNGLNENKLSLFTDGAMWQWRKRFCVTYFLGQWLWCSSGRRSWTPTWTPAHSW